MKYLSKSLSIFMVSLCLGNGLKKDKRIFVDEIILSVSTGLPYLIVADGSYILRARGIPIFPSLEGDVSIGLNYSMAAYFGVNYQKTDDIVYKILIGGGFAQESNIFSTGEGSNRVGNGSNQPPPDVIWQKTSIQLCREKYFKGSNYFGYKYGLGLESWQGYINNQGGTGSNFGEIIPDERIIFPRISIGTFISIL